MSSSILDSLPNLHGTMLSIIVGFLTAYVLYVWQATDSAKQKLESVKRQVQDICTPSLEVGIDEEAYMDKAGQLDWMLVKRHLLEAAMLFPRPDYSGNGLPRKIVIVDDSKGMGDEFNPADSRVIQTSQIEETAKRVLGLSGLVMTSYPYLGKGMLNKKLSKPTDADSTLSERRIADIEARSVSLLWVWDTRNRELSELMSQYRTINIRRQENMHEENLQEAIESAKKAGSPLPEEEVARIRKQFHRVYDRDYGLALRESFEKVRYLQQQVIPHARENLTVLTTYERQFRVKTWAKVILGGAAVIFIIGILVPLVLSGCTKPAPWRSVAELVILVVTTIPYLAWLFYLMHVLTRMGQP